MVNRQTRDPGLLRRFEETARIGGVPDFVVPGGDAWRTLAQVAGGLSERLGRLADQAAQREGALAGLSEGAASGARYLQMQATQQAAETKELAKQTTDEGGYDLVPHLTDRSRLPHLQGISPEFRGALRRMIASAPDGIRQQIRLLSGYRSPERQAQLFSEAVQKYGSEAAARKWVAPPGRSKHNHGQAYDLQYGSAEARKWVHENAGRFGLHFPMAHEPWHIEPIGARGKAKAAAAAADLPAVPVVNATPLALRRDGTIYGEAYDRAAASAMAWRMQAGLEQQIAQAAIENPDDPAALTARLAEIHDQFANDPSLGDPELREAFDRRFTERSQAEILQARAKAEARMRAEEMAAAKDGIEALRLGVERQAMALGASPEGDAIIAREVEKAGRAIDSAVAAGTLTPAQAAAEKERIATSAATARAQGVFDALPTPRDKEEFALGLMREWTEGKGPLAKLPLATVRALSQTLFSQARQLANENIAARRLEAARLEQLVRDDIASISATGKGIDPAQLDPATVEAVLGPVKLDDWRSDRAIAESTWQATADMPILTPLEIEERLQQLAPQPGEPGFEQKARVFDAATKKAREVLKQRSDDPAKAAQDAFPEVAALAENATIDNPEAMQALLSARLQAQAALGVDELGRAPLTNDEARNLARAVTSQVDPSGQAKAMMELVDQVSAAYGPHADAVLTQVLQQRGMDREMAAYGAQLFRRTNAGERPSEADKRQGSVLNETAAAEGAMRPRATEVYPLPNYRQQQMLLSNPELAPQFDEKFGPGASARVLGQLTPGTDRRVEGGVATRDEEGEGFIPDGR